jgi:uncharacterized protein (TIGR00252 family)
MPLGEPIEGINDSKKVSEKRREKLYPIILERAIAVGVALVSSEEIDRINILNATKQAMRQAYTSMECEPGILLTDAMAGLELPVETRAIIHGDGISYNIAAASIVAKVTRDRLMRELDGQYPGYGFAQHKGYGTADHIEALRRLGPCPVHRRSFLGNIAGATRQEKGRAAENMAEKYLMSEGLLVLERNWRTVGAEVDLIADDGGVLAFVEVKYRDSDRYGAPRQAVDGAKRRYLTRAAVEYVQRSGRGEAACRFDVVEIIRVSGGYDITYLKDAFPAERGDFFL